MLKSSWRKCLFFISLLLCLSWHQIASIPTPIASGQVLGSSVQQGLEHYLSGDFQGAIAVWNQSLQPESETDEQLTLLKYLARAYSQIGQYDRAIASLEILITHYEKTGDHLQLSRMLTEQAQAYSNLGQQRKAIALLCGEPAKLTCTEGSAITLASQRSDKLGEAAGAGSLGNVYRLQGDYEASLHWLKQSLLIAKNIKKPAYIHAANTGIGNTYANLAKRAYRYADYATASGKFNDAKRLTHQARAHDQQAIASFQASIQGFRQQNNTLEESQALLNLASVYQRSVSTSPQPTLKRALALQKQLPNSRDKAYSLIRLASLLQQADSNQPQENPNLQCYSQAPPETIPLLNQAIAISQHIQDPQAESFALGRLGHLYECQQNFTQASKLTQLAQFAAQNQGSSYLWDWQQARILVAQGKTIEAIAAYENAVKVLKNIRGNLAIASRDYQFDFRDTVEPIYRELTELQLVSNAPISSINQVNVTPKRALETIDDLRIAELQNYLGEDCSIPISAQPVTQVSDQTAVISTIILKDRIAVILDLPNAEPKLHWIPEQNQTVLATVNELRLKLEDRSDLANTYEQPSQQLYDWLIRPFTQELDQANVDTLVFIQDGILRSIPMTALYDGTAFLVEHYGIATTTSLTLIEPTQLEPRSLRALGFGLTQASSVSESSFFAPLDFVKAELDQMANTLSGSKIFMNEAFTIDRLQQELTTGDFPIVHLATHGKFGVDSRETFLVTGKHLPATQSQIPNAQSYNEKLTMNQLYKILQTSQQRTLELLTLTACETAVGNDRDSLGIAGISIQAGAKSAIASLWQVDDQATAELITQFYENLREGMGRAKALQVAQQQWLQQHNGAKRHPGYWAALTLVGNWL